MEEKSVDRSRLEKGEYADYFEVGHDFVAFVVDCGQSGYDVQEPKLYSRIITSPLGALRLVGVLANALCQYTGSFGSIRNEEGNMIPQVKDMEKALGEYARKFADIFEKNIN